MLKLNKNTVQRIFQLKGWQVRKKPSEFRPRVKMFLAVALQPNKHWSTDLARVWCKQDRWYTLVLVMDYCTYEILGWRSSRSAKAKAAEVAVEEALIKRFGYLSRVPEMLKLRSDNGLVFYSKTYTCLVKSYRLGQEFITFIRPSRMAW